jgi:hypothetical protein
MQSLDNQANDEEKQEKLDQDYDKPFSPPDDISGQGRMPRDDPRKDTGMDEDEWYDEGENAAAGQQDDQKDDKEGGARVA